MSWHDPRQQGPRPLALPPPSGTLPGERRGSGGGLRESVRGLDFSQGSEVLSPRSEPLSPRQRGGTVTGGPQPQQKPLILDQGGGVHDTVETVSEPQFNGGTWAELDRNKSIHASPGDRTKVLTKLDKGAMVRRLPDPAQQKGGVSWVKVRFRKPDGEIGEGWVKEHAAQSTVTVEHVDLTGPILPVGELPKPDDVRQSGIGDCYLMAGLVTVAQQRPQAIVDMFSPSPHDTTGDTVGLRFFRQPQTHERNAGLAPRWVTVRKSLVRYVRPPGSQGPSSLEGQKRFTKGGAVWPAIVEKAYAAWPERKTRGGITNAQSKYEEIEGGHGADVLEQLTGETHQRISLANFDQDVKRGSGRYTKGLLDLFARLQDNLARDGMLTVGTPQDWSGTDLEHAKKAKGFAGEPVRGGMAGKHEYAIVATSEADGLKYVHVRNPWGEFGMKYKKQFGKLVGFQEVKGEKGCVTKIELSDLPRFFDTIGATY